MNLRQYTPYSHGRTKIDISGQSNPNSSLTGSKSASYPDFNKKTSKNSPASTDKANAKSLGLWYTHHRLSSRYLIKASRNSARSLLGAAAGVGADADVAAK